MLHYEAIDLPTLATLKRLLQIELFSELRLVGGTSLALQIGHRKSIDIDLFGVLEADEISVAEALKEFNSVKRIHKTEHISIYSIEGVKVDIVNYPYPWLGPAMESDGIRLAQKEDIAAMKLSAIAGRGTKKDFVDISFLLQHYTLGQMFDFYMQKYHDGSEFMVLKSLSFFGDAEKEQDPIMLLEQDWAATKAHILQTVKNYL